MNGIARCARYSFGPNRLHYCGPDRNIELGERINRGDFDTGAEHLLREFKTLFPYLQLIAKANGIADPFDARVVEAYWLGNNLLERVDKYSLYHLLQSDFNLKSKTGSKEFAWLEKKVGQGALPHHSFHVLNIWRQAGADRREAQLPENLSECCVNAGKIISIDGPRLEIETSVPILFGRQFSLSPPMRKTLTRQLEAEYDLEQLKPGQLISYHWSVACEVINETQARNLKKYTLQNIFFANATL